MGDDPICDRRTGYTPINIAPADVLENSKWSGNATAWGSSPRPFAEVPDEDAIAVAQAAVRARDTIARDRDRLATENAALRERMAHLEHKPLPLVEWPREECVDHLAARRRAEGADLLPRHEKRMPFERAVPRILLGSIAAWLAIIVGATAFIKWMW